MSVIKGQSKVKLTAKPYSKKKFEDIIICLNFHKVIKNVIIID